MKKIKIYKERQYLIFDFENGKRVKYDLSKKQAIGVSGKPVKDLKTQLHGITMNEVIECCEDKQYGKFLNFIQKRYPYDISNIGTILSHVPDYAHYEQIFSAGFEDIVDRNFSKTINDVPKSLIKIAKNRNIKLSDRFCDFWKHNSNAYYIAYQLDYMSLTDDDIYRILGRNYWDIEKKTCLSYYNILIDEYNYNPKSLLLYIDSLVTYEAFDDVGDLIRELDDYVRMMSRISNKFDKYPRNFLTTHQIACRNYNRLKEQFKENEFKNRIDKRYECSFGKYTFIYPNSTQDIKDEAVKQNNCVASYIKKVIDGQCHILFLRKKGFENDSLVTIEVDPIKNIIVQAKGKFNRDVTEEENKAIEAWNKKFSINKDMEVAA